ncbi:bifunctional DNA-formamidopyrimidine glycosylase/DNA-(apurinic or apyrimidinic site) lyase [Candidatus Pseudothioglobus singularis]|nr:bifunctional DNA-formamidopyrimidine glycosylase/DNA-(apurinic or apyrimidinic site) lyase [Candidatus Pseudothioglobus singularis]
MPELPEVETTKRGLKPLIVNRSVLSAHIYKKKLRWEIPSHLIETLKNKTINNISRRAKYLLIGFGDGQLVIHLGMSGSMSVVPSKEPLKKHHHFELKLDNLTSIRFHDPRRFGSILWQDNDSHLKLLSNLGPEPLSYDFNNEVLFNASIGKSKNIKTFIMDSKVVVGIGNIYASESLFLAGISPKRVSGKTSKNRYQTLTDSIKKILTDAINNGGTTLNDFSNVDGSPGYFSQILSVYNRENMPCIICDSKIKRIIQNQRATYYCPKCQN